MTSPEHAIHYLEIVTPDVDGACRFYTSALGWPFSPPVPALGNALVAALPDGSWCGIRAPLHEAEVPVVRPYFRVPDLEAATRTAEQSGAMVLLESMELPGWGRISIVEVGGLQQGLWQVP
jgi:hypothetical protein